MGTIASLHLHPPVGGQAMLAVDSFDLVAEKGIVGNRRYFDRRNRAGLPSKRQITLIEREQIDQHAAALNAGSIKPGEVRSNVETIGINLVQLVGRKIRIGTAILLVREPRDPCAKMDLILPGLRARMAEGKQGIIAQVIASGTVRVGDAIELLREGEFSFDPSK